MTQTRKKARRIIVSLSVTLILAMVAAGCVVADRNIRRIGFGESAPVFSTVTQEEYRGVRIRLMGKEAFLDFTPCVSFSQNMARWVQRTADVVEQTACDLFSQIIPPGIK